MQSEMERAYGCLFCMTGKEKYVAQNIEAACPDVRAIWARQEKYKSVEGKKIKIEAILLPSYVFFEAPVHPEALLRFPQDNVIRILRGEGDDWRLYGEDERFTRWLFTYGGLLDFSKAYREGDAIKIISGPLKDLEGQIRRIDKRGKSGQVTLTFNRREVNVWLGFDLVEPVK